MNLSQFPERFRARVLASVVRHGRQGIAIRFGELDGQTLPLVVSQEPTRTPALPAADLESLARTTFASLPYELRVRVE